MGLVKKLLSSIRPHDIDILLYQFADRNTIAKVPEIDGSQLQREGNTFILRKEGLLVHRSRIFFKSHLLSNFGFTKPFLTIGDCLTDDRYRGRGIYPAVIRYIGAKFSKEREVYVLVAPDNHASIRGIEKASFHLVGRIRCVRVLIFYVKKSIQLSGND